MTSWLLPILLSAIALGVYDIAKKHAVRDNSVMPVLFFATLTGTTVFVLFTLFNGTFSHAFFCGWNAFGLLALKSLLVAASWTCVYYAMRELPISIAAPIRASSPLWTFLGSLILFSEIPTWLQGLGMISIFSGYYIFSIMGKMEGISFRKHKGIHLIMAGTILGACSALYDKFLLGIMRIPRDSVQFWFSVDLVLIFALALLVRKTLFQKGRPFIWKWSIPLTGILLIVADCLYFEAISVPNTHISILSLLRRCSCIVTFAAGSWYFKDSNLKGKAAALAAILLGVLLIAAGS